MSHKISVEEAAVARRLLVLVAALQAMLHLAICQFATLAELQTHTLAALVQQVAPRLRTVVHPQHITMHRKLRMEAISHHRRVTLLAQVRHLLRDLQV